MTFQMPGSSTVEVVTQESLLQSALERIERIRQGRIAVYLHLSRLRPQNRQEGHIRIALRILEPMVNAYRGQMFQMGNADVVFLLKDPNMTDVENMIYKLRALFSKDPLTFSDSGDGVDNFCSTYDLGGEQFETFFDLVRDLVNEVRKKNKKKTVTPPEPAPIDSKVLGDVLERLKGADVTKLIRRQSAYIINERANAEVLFQEFFVGSADLQKAMAPDINLLANRWLFQHLSETLDRRVLAALRQPPLRHLPNVFSLNLNISTVLSRPFVEFSKSIGDAAGITVEIQVLDVLATSKAYFEARDRLREAKHMVAIDGLSETTLQFMDIAQFDADLYKINWSPEMRETDRSTAIMNTLMPIGTDRLLLARCDSEAAIRWGLDKGIARFQGRYVDTMIAAFTMAVCDKSKACTLGQCVARHGVLAGPPRPDCGNLDMLDKPPVIRAPAARKRA